MTPAPPRSSRSCTVLDMILRRILVAKLELGDSLHRYQLSYGWSPANAPVNFGSLTVAQQIAYANTTQASPTSNLVPTLVMASALTPSYGVHPCELAGTDGPVSKFTCKYPLLSSDASAKARLICTEPFTLPLQPNRNPNPTPIPTLFVTCTLIVAPP